MATNGAFIRNENGAGFWRPLPRQTLCLIARDNRADAVA
jgi:hypothetical protein